MKLKILIILFLCISALNAQNLSLNFDENLDYNMFIKNDTFRNAKPWQIGSPNKPVFKPDNTHKRVLITDSINSCNKSDTYSTVIEFVRESRTGVSSILKLSFDYAMHGDTGDIGEIEVSPDLGKNWINILKDYKTYRILWSSPKPNLRGKSNGWKNCICDLSAWDNFGIYPVKLSGKDTILFRFSYHTDSTTFSRDGWMIDNIFIQYGWSSINKVNNNSGGFTIYPQPSSDIIYFSNKKNWSIDGVEIYNTLGQKMMYNYSENITSINTENLPNGLYSVRIKSNEEWYEQKLVVER